MNSGRARALVAAVGLSVLIAGCGEQPWSERAGSTLSPRTRIVVASDNTAAASSARFSMVIQLTGGPEEVGDITAEGALDFESSAAQMTMHVGGSQPIDGEVRIVAGTVYVNYGGQWQSEDVGSVDFGDMSDSMDPSRYLDFLRDAGADVREVGSDTIRGETTTRFEATISLERVMSSTEMTAQERAQLDEALALFGSELPDVRLGVWIDGDDRVRRVHMGMDMSELFGGSMDVTMDLYDFGVPVHISAPKVGSSASSGLTS